MRTSGWPFCTGWVYSTSTAATVPWIRAATGWILPSTKASSVDMWVVPPVECAGHDGHQRGDREDGKRLLPAGIPLGIVAASVLSFSHSVLLASVSLIDIGPILIHPPLPGERN